MLPQLVFFAFSFSELINEHLEADAYLPRPQHGIDHVVPTTCIDASVTDLMSNPLNNPRGLKKHTLYGMGTKHQKMPHIGPVFTNRQ